MLRLRALLVLTLCLVAGAVRAETYPITQGSSQICTLCSDNGDGSCSTSTSAFTVSVDVDSSGLCREDGNVATLVTRLNGGLPAALGSGGGLKVDGSGTPLSVTISATGATVMPEIDASKALQPVFATVTNSTETSQFTTGCTGSCRRVTVCNTSTTATGCVKLNSGWTTGYPVYPRGSTGPPTCVSFQNVSYVAGGTNEAGLCNGADVPFAVYPEDD